MTFTECTIMILLKILLIFGVVVSPNLAKTLSVTPNVCNSGLCKYRTFILKNSMNQSIKPCDNFYDYVCGTTRVANVYSEINYRLSKRLPKLMNQNFEGGPSYLQKLQKYYRICMDEEKLNMSSEDNLKKILNNLGGWPVLDKNKSEPSFEWLKTIQKLYEIGYSPTYFFKFDISSDDKNSINNIIYLDQPSFGIDRAYLVQGSNSTVVKAYLEYMVDVAKILGANDDVQEQLQRSLEFEIKLAEISVSLAQQLDKKQLYNVMSFKELQSKYPDIQWLDYFNGIFQSHVKIDALEKVNVLVPSFFDKFFQLMKEKTLNGTYLTDRDIRNYVMWRVTLDSIDKLSSRIRSAKAKFEDALLGYASGDDRTSTCTDEVKENMYLAASALYFSKYCNDKNMKFVGEMVEKIRGSIDMMIKKLNWMDTATKKSMLEKLHNIDVFIGHSPKLRNDTMLDNYYRDFQVQEENHLNTSLNIRRFIFEKSLDNFKKPFDKSDWTNYYRNVLSANGFYEHYNTVYIPAIMFQELSIDQRAPNYLNYAFMGEIIGHEMLHSFDYSNRIFDKHGNVVDWWSPPSDVQYSAMSQCLIDRFSNYTYEDGINANGELTLTENMADIGGVKTAYLAYKALQNNTPPEPVLPGFEDKTPEQMFWITYASSYCSLTGTKENENSRLTDNHLPFKLRVLGTLSNLPEFAKDFGCQSVDGMYPRNACHMW